MKPQNVTKQSSHLVTFFNCCFYLALVPFKTCLNPKTNQYFLKSFTFHKIVCGLSNLTAMFFLFNDIIGGVIHLRHEVTIILVIDLVCNLSAFLTALLFLQVSWTRGNLYLEVVERTRVSLDTNAKKITTIGICLLFSGMAAFSAVIHWLYFLEEYITCGRVSQDEPEFYLSFPCGANWYVTLLNAWQSFSGTFLVALRGTYVVLVLALRQLGKELVTELGRVSAESDIGKGINLYGDLKRTTDLIRNVFGDYLLTFYVTSVSYYAEIPYLFLGKSISDTDKVAVLYFVGFGLVWMMAAEFQNNVRNAVFKWIKVFTDKDKLGTGDRLRLLCLSNEISSDPVAVASRCFPVTYSHIGSMVSLIVTYGVIVFQFYQKDYA